MNKRSRYLVAIVLIFTATFFIVKKLKRNPVSRVDLPALAINDLNGNIININGFSGKPLVINFWGSWCGPCRQELPGFEKAKVKYGNQVNFLMISDEDLDKIKKFKSENNYTFYYARSQKRFRELGITSVPVTCFYDARGKLINTKMDPINENELDRLMAEIVR